MRLHPLQKCRPFNWPVFFSLPDKPSSYCIMERRASTRPLGSNLPFVSDSLDEMAKTHRAPLIRSLEPVSANYRSRKSQSEVIQLHFCHFKPDSCNVVRPVGPVNPTCHLRDRQRNHKEIPYLAGGLSRSQFATAIGRVADHQTVLQILMQML